MIKLSHNHKYYVTNLLAAQRLALMQITGHMTH